MTETTIRFLPIGFCGCAVAAIVLIFLVIVYYYIVLGVGKGHRRDDGLPRDIQNEKEKRIKVKVTRQKGESEEKFIERICARHDIRVKTTNAYEYPHRVFCEKGLFGRAICIDFNYQLECVPSNLERTKEIISFLRKEAGWGNVSVHLVDKHLFGF